LEGKIGNKCFKEPKHLKDVYVELKCSLGELYNGCEKLVEFEKTVINRFLYNSKKLQQDGRSTKVVKETR